MDGTPRDSSGDAPPLPTPQMEASTRIALWVLACVLLFAIASVWLPEPAGWIAFMLVMYVGLSLGLMVLLDFRRLKTSRLALARMQLAPPTVDDPAARVLLDATALAQDMLKPWRAWRPWLAGFALLAIAVGFLVPGPPTARVTAAAVVFVVGLLRDAFLAINALEVMPADAWASLRRPERALLRAYAAVLGSIVLAGSLAVVAALGWSWLQPEDMGWKIVPATFIWGGLAFYGVGYAWKWIAAARRHVDRGAVAQLQEIWRSEENAD